MAEAAALKPNEGTPVPGEGGNQVSEVEQQALDMGWRPKTEWDGDPDEWKSAKQFVKDKGLFDYIDTLKSQVHGLKRDFKEVYNKISASERAKYEARILELTAQKKAAAKEGDVEAVEDIRDEIDATKTKLIQENQQPVQKGPDPDFVTWVEQNPWYTQNLSLQAEADGFAKSYVAEHGENATFKQVLNHVTTKMKKLYPEKFGVTKQTVASVEGSTNTPRRSGTKFDSSDLDPTAKEVMRTFIKQKIYGDIPDHEAEARYIKEYMKARGA